MDGRIGFAGDGGRADGPVAMVEGQTMSSAAVVIPLFFDLSHSFFTLRASRREEVKDIECVQP